MDIERDESNMLIIPLVLASIFVFVAWLYMSFHAGMTMWVFIFDLRFQADAALLLVVMLVLNALAAMFLVPSWVMIFRPSFIGSTRKS